MTQDKKLKKTKEQEYEFLKKQIIEQNKKEMLPTFGLNDQLIKSKKKIRQLKEK